MDDNSEFERPEKERDPREGVRLIGADEAEEAMERDDVASRRGEGVPKYGDRPESPPTEGPRPQLRFPLPGSGDPSAIDRPRAEPPGDDDTEMPHWTEPATGEVPQVLRDEGDDDDDLDAWSSLGSSPRWRDQGSDWDSHDFDDVARLGDDETRVGALDGRDRPAPDDFFSMEDDYDDTGRPGFGGSDEPPAHQISSDPRRRPPTVQNEGAGRNVPVAIVTGVGLAAIALVLFAIGPGAAMLLVTPIIGLAAAEFYDAARKAGYQPATLLGLSASVSLVLAAYWRGEAAYGVVLFLTIVFCLLWYVSGVSNERVVESVGVTLIGVVYVGLLGSFAALMLTFPNGVGMLLGAIIATVGYDVGGFVIGRNAGTRPLSEASPNKTVEGLAGGCIVAIALTTLVMGIVPGVHPFDSVGDAFLLGLTAAVAAPLGDLCESRLKRDLGVKDMGSILPGHGGVLDRFDALLFVLPSTYFLVRILDLF